MKIKSEGSVSFPVGLANGLWIASRIAAALAVSVQVIYALGWLVMPTMVTASKSIPTTAWCFAGDADWFCLLGGVLVLLMLGLAAMVIVGLAELGGWDRYPSR